MIVLGLTGSIGMGKTTAAGMLQKLGCPVHNSDKAVHDALAPGGVSFEEVAVTFPEAWDKKKHLIKRDVLGKIVFNDDEKRGELEEILHPVARASQDDFLKRQRMTGRRIVALDIPLLFETGAESRVDYTVVMTAPFDVQRRRVLARKGMTEAKFKAILDAQMPDGEKRARADFIVHTGMGRAYTYRELQRILKEVS